MTQSPLELPGWLEYNAWRTGLKPWCYSTGADDRAEARAVFYLDRRGRVNLPPKNPYLSVVIRNERQRPSGRTAEWLRIASPLVDEMKRRGAANQLILPPDVEDVRPWSWSGFLVGVAYTYVLDFPVSPSNLDPSHRSDIAKAAANGMTAERVTDVGPVIACLEATEDRVGRSLGMGARELRAAADLVGADNLRMYVCFDASGQAASSCVILHVPGARALLWLAGVRRTQASVGAGPLLWRFAMDDVASAGAVGIDLCGANIRSIAAFKSRWGTRLVPSYSVRPYSVRAGLRFLADWRHSRDRRPHTQESTAATRPRPTGPRQAGGTQVAMERDPIRRSP